MIVHAGKQKMIIAVLQDDDYEDIIAELTANQFYVTILHSEGGFLRRKSVTIMIVTAAELVEDAMDILEKYAGSHEEYTESPVILGRGGIGSGPIPMKIRCNSVVIFVLDVDEMIRW